MKRPLVIVVHGKVTCDLIVLAKFIGKLWHAFHLFQWDEHQQKCPGKLKPFICTMSLRNSQVLSCRHANCNGLPKWKLSSLREEAWECFLYFCLMITRFGKCWQNSGNVGRISVQEDKVAHSCMYAINTSTNTHNTHITTFPGAKSWLWCDYAVSIINFVLLCCKTSESIYIIKHI